MLVNEKLRAFLFRYGPFLLPAIVLLLHLPFLFADPDFYLSHSRDAHSDEGLNTSQIRNFVNYGYIDPMECDNLIKNPLFNLIMAGPFFIFGTKLWAGRITVLLFGSLTILFLSRNRSLRWFWLLFIPVAWMQFHIFSYMHFSMAEMAAVSCILIAVYHCFCFTQWSEAHKRRKHLALAVLFSSLSWFFKIQFAYMVVFVPVIFFSWWLRKTILTRKVTREGALLLALCAGCALLPVALYYFSWFLPLKEAYTYIMHNQASNRFAAWKDIFPIVRENYHRYFTTQQVVPLFYLFLLAFVTGPVLYFTQPGKIFRGLFPVAFFWAVLESHKMLIHFVPSRYLVSAYVAMAFLITAVLYEALRRFIFAMPAHDRRKYIGWFGAACFTWLLANHVISYVELYQRRTFHIHEVNRYLSQYNLEGVTAAGPWAPSLTWDTKARCIPVWSGFLNDKNINEKLHPGIVFSEPDEADSEQAFCKDGFDLATLSDSVRTYRIGRWPVNLYWIKQEYQ